MNPRILIAALEWYAVLERIEAPLEIRETTGRYDRACKVIDEYYRERARDALAAYRAAEALHAGVDVAWSGSDRAVVEGTRLSDGTFAPFIHAAAPSAVIPELPGEECSFSAGSCDNAAPFLGEPPGESE